MRHLCSPTVFALAIMMTWVPVVIAEPQKGVEKVCELSTLVAGQVDGRIFRSDGPSADSARTLRVTFRDQDPKAGKAKLVVDGLGGDRAVAMAIDEGAIVYLHEDAAGKLMVSTATKPGTDSWPAVATQHGWGRDGRLTLKAMTGFCLMRKR